MRRPLPIARAGVLVALAAWVILSRHSRPAAPPAPLVSVPPVAPVWAVDVSNTPEGSALAGRTLTVPDGPLKGQQRPPCPPAYNVINGGCWLRAEAKPSPECPETLWKHGSGCYLPLLATQAPPNALGR